MVSEVRFRDIICHESNIDLLSKEIGKIIGKDNLKLSLISKELPLPFDVIGLQLKFCDIVCFDKDNNVYIIELKSRINEKRLNRVEKQVQEYIDTFYNALKFIERENSLFYHFVLIRYFEFINYDYKKLNKIIPVIVSIEEMDKEVIEKCTFSCGYLESKTKENLFKNFINNKINHFMNTYNDVFSNLEINIKISDILIYANKKGKIDSSLWFPVVLNKINKYSEIENKIAYSYQINFENLNNYNKKIIDVTDYYESFLEFDLKNEIQKEDNLIYDFFNGANTEKNLIEHSFIPEVYFEFEPLEIFDKIYNSFQNTLSNEKSLEFIIQIFRSGRTVPIIYLQVSKNVYIPLIQIKPVVVSIGPCVNNVIAYDMKEHFNEDKNCYYEDVISLDRGTFEITLEESEGVQLYIIQLNGRRNKYRFIAYSPKIRAVEELLPYMTPERVKIHLKNVASQNGADYLFKADESDPVEWITSRLHIIPEKDRNEYQSKLI